MRMHIDFTLHEYIEWLQQQEALLLSGRYPASEAYLDSEPIGCFISDMDGPAGIAELDGDRPLYNFGLYGESTCADLPAWTLPLVRKYTFAARSRHTTVVHISEAMLDALRLLDGQEVPTV